MLIDGDNVRFCGLPPGTADLSGAHVLRWPLLGREIAARIVNLHRCDSGALFIGERLQEGLRAERKAGQLLGEMGKAKRARKGSPAVAARRGDCAVW